VRTDFPAFFMVLVDFLSGVASRQRGTSHDGKVPGSGPPFVATNTESEDHLESGRLAERGGVSAQPQPMPVAAKSPAGSSLLSVLRLRRRILAFKRFGVLNPLLRHAPASLSWPGAILVIRSHSATNLRKVSEGVIGRSFRDVAR
jgi:hypothetical protein